jgi:hypothetical protein
MFDLMNNTLTHAEAETAEVSRIEKIHSFLVEKMEKIALSKSDRAMLTWWDIEVPYDGMILLTIETPYQIYGAGLMVHDMLESYAPFISVSKRIDVMGNKKATNFYIKTN